jgi:trigger factor
MQVSVEKVSNVEYRLTIVVPTTKVEEAYAKQIEKIARKANIKGFRPGKAPLTQIKQQYGDDAWKDTLNEVIQQSLYQAIVDHQLKPISSPRVEPKQMLPGQPLEFIAIVETLPEIGTIQFSLANIEKLTVEVSPEDIERVVEQLRKQYSKWSVVEREAQATDRVVIDYYAIFDGKSDIENKITNYPLELASKTMLPGFEEGLLGLKAGDEKTLQLKFPDNFSVAERAGKPVEFVISVKEVFAADMPAVDQAFVQRLGVKSGQVEDLKTQIKQSLDQERDRLVSEKLKEQVFRNLIEQNPLEVPNSLIAKEAASIHDEIYPQHQHHDHHQHSPDEMATFNDIAKKRVSLGLLIGAYANQAGVKADAAKVEQRIKEIASLYENPQEVIGWLSTDERRSGIEAQVMEDQVLNKLMENVPVTAKTMSYAELKGIRI